MWASSQWFNETTYSKGGTLEPLATPCGTDVYHVSIKIADWWGEDTLFIDGFEQYVNATLGSNCNLHSGRWPAQQFIENGEMACGNIAARQIAHMHAKAAHVASSAQFNTLRWMPVDGPSLQTWVQADNARLGYMQANAVPAVPMRESRFLSTSQVEYLVRYHLAHAQGVVGSGTASALDTFLCSETPRSMFWGEMGSTNTSLNANAPADFLKFFKKTCNNKMPGSKKERWHHPGWQLAPTWYCRAPG